MKRSIVFLGVIALTVPLLFMGCSGNDGATGAAGAPGGPGPAGPPGAGVTANETCALCHGAGDPFDVAAMHARAALVPLTITGVAYADNPDNVALKIVTVSFDYAGAANILDNNSPTQLRFPRFYLAKLVPGAAYPASGTFEPDTWVRTVSGERVNGNLTPVDADSYTYRFSYNVQPADQALTHRVGIYLDVRNSGLPAGSIVKFATYDSVPDGSPVTVTRNIVSTAACQQCHDPLGFNALGETDDPTEEGPGAAFHDGLRNTAESCVLCHRVRQGARDNTVLGFNPETGVFEGTGQAHYPYMVHKIHGTHQLEERTGENWVFHGKDYAEITYPQDIRNCKTCHKGDPDGDNWKNRPSMAACGSCHSHVNFVTGAGHTGGAWANNQFCGLCHSPTAIETYHATENATPNNPQLNGGLATFAYFIDNVTVNASNQAVVTFRITKDGTPVNLAGPYPPTGFSGGPSFLVAYANNVTSPQDYSNFGRSAGQPASVSLSSVRASMTSTDNVTFTATLASAPFPDGATMRAVALQGYFTQTGVDHDGKPSTPSVDVGRHTPSVEMAVDVDKAAKKVRRKIIKSGYNAVSGQPEGCLECHEIFEGHGGNRVNNVQVCVMCHNPSLTSSGRTTDAALLEWMRNATANDLFPSQWQNQAGTLRVSAGAIESAQNTYDHVGGNPLIYPEVSNNFKDLIHGIHSGLLRGTPYKEVRNRGTSGIYYYDFSEVTFPGDLRNCLKCHETTPVGPGDPVTYDADLPLGVDLSTTRITSGDPAETMAMINAFRGTVPNITDLVNSPIAAACGMCHNSETAISHFQLNGGKVQAEREYAETPIPTMAVIGVPAP